MSAPERAGQRSRAWLAVPATPVVVAALVLGGLPAAVLSALIAVQVAVLSPWAGRLGAAIGERLAAVPDQARRRWRRAVSGAAHVLPALVLRVGPALVGTAVLVVAADWALGQAWDRVTGAPDDVVEAENLAAEELPPSGDERADHEAYDGSAW
ncbi:MAG: hypothetical protein KDB10_24200, partial [Acidimicrobiales bacterium]|nr:hypothetical protein [Acidimicrobiales bacterium]